MTTALSLGRRGKLRPKAILILLSGITLNTAFTAKNLREWAKQIRRDAGAAWASDSQLALHSRWRGGSRLARIKIEVLV
jgi:hypothetical protein